MNKVTKEQYEFALARVEEPVSYTHLDVYKRQGYYRGMEQLVSLPL